MLITAYHFDRARSARGKECMAIFEGHGGKFQGCGTCLVNMERDVGYKVPKKHVDALRAAPIEAGFTLEPSAERTEAFGAALYPPADHCIARKNPARAYGPKNFYWRKAVSDTETKFGIEDWEGTASEADQLELTAERASASRPNVRQAEAALRRLEEDDVAC
jgi:hypothetical protein